MKKDYPNKITIEAMQETERLLADPNTKYYDVEEALLKLKDGTVLASWDELEKELFTPEEIQKSNRRAMKNYRRIKRRQKKARRALRELKIKK